MSYTWNDNSLKKRYEKEKESILDNPIYNFSKEELEHPYLQDSVFKTKSPNIWRKIVLAFTLGKMNAIKSIDEGKTLITLDPMEDIETRFEIIPLYANYDEDIQTYGDIYTSIEDLKKEHPSEKLMLGFGIVDKLNLISNIPDWFETYEDACKEKETLIKENK